MVKNIIIISKFQVNSLIVGLGNTGVPVRSVVVVADKNEGKKLNLNVTRIRMNFSLVVFFYSCCCSLHRTVGLSFRVVPRSRG